MQSLTRARLRSTAAGLGLAVLGGVFGALAAKHLSAQIPPHAGGKTLAAASLLVSLPISFFLGVALHEGGHLIAGKMLGGRFSFVIIGPLRVMRTPSGLKWGRNRRFPLFGGLALVIPNRTDRLRSYLMGLLAGGPLASLVSGFFLLAAATAWIRLHPPGAELGVGSFFVWTLLGTGGLLSLMLALVSLVPSRTGGFASDGARLIALSRKGPEGEREALVFTLTALSLSGVRSRDLPDDLMTRAVEVGGDPQVVAAMRLLAYFWALDQGRLDAARTYLFQAAEGSETLAPFLRDALHAELAYFSARHENNPATARAWLEKAGPCELSEETRLRAEAAVLLAEKQWEAAEARARDAIAARERSLAGTSSPEALEWAEAIRSEAIARQSAPSPRLSPPREQA